MIVQMTNATPIQIQQWDLFVSRPCREGTSCFYNLKPLKSPGGFEWLSNLILLSLIEFPAPVENLHQKPTKINGKSSLTFSFIAPKSVLICILFIAQIRQMCLSARHNIIV